MKLHIRFSIIILLAVFANWINPGHADTTLDIETGLLQNASNDVGIPGDTGSRFSLTSDLKTDISPFLRLKIHQTLGKKHNFSVLYAPLTVKSQGKKSTPIDFAGTTFPANQDIEGTYKFNSYRLTYRYDFVQTPKNEFGMGLTAKIRDARIALKSGELSAEKTNVGFVPIVNFRWKHNFSDKYSLILDGDALAAPQGRAEDVLMAGMYHINEKISLKAGYRILEGGADNDEVYGFALFNYAVLGVTIDLW